MQKKFDVTCFAGYWPFHSTRFPRCQQIADAHARYGIEGGLVSSLQSVFYADPLTAAAELAKELPPSYGQIFPINPELPAAAELCEEALEKYHIRGLRLVPCFHEIKWNSPRTRAVFDFAEKHSLPLMITFRLEDERLQYIAMQLPSQTWAMTGEIYDLPQVPIILTHLSLSEITPLSGPITRRNDIYVDTSFLNSPVLCLEKVVAAIGSRHVMFGSGFNRQALGSAVANLTHADLTPEEKSDIWYENAARTFHL